MIENTGSRGLKAPGAKILMLSNEYPPASVGGLGRAVCDLAKALVRLGNEVHVVTANSHGLPGEETAEGVRIHRARPGYACSGDLLEGNLVLNIAMAEKAMEVASHVGIQVIHAHDWLTARAAKAVRTEMGLPLAATIHATEHGRNNGIRTPMQSRIHSLEWELAYGASAVIACSRYMVEEVSRLFSLPQDKVHEIPNGFGFRTGHKRGIHGSGVRDKYALPWEKLVFFVGRMVWEKGIDTLLRAVPGVLAECPEAKFVIAGTGPMSGAFRDLACRLGLGEKVHFPGYMPDDERDVLFGSCAAAVFPSLYEPFGIVALEAMALGAPVIVSDTGGLGGLVDTGVDGLKTPPGDSESLCRGILRLLECPSAARVMALRGAEKVKREFGWEPVAQRTMDVYRQLSKPADEGTEREVLAI